MLLHYRKGYKYFTCNCTKQYLFNSTRSNASIPKVNHVLSITYVSYPYMAVIIAHVYFKKGIVHPRTVKVTRTIPIERLHM